MSIHKRKKFIPRLKTTEPTQAPKKSLPKVEVVKVNKGFKQIAEEALRKPVEAMVHPLLTKPLNELAPYEVRKLEIYHEWKGSIPLEDIFVDPGNGVELYRNPSTGGWLFNPIHREVN